MKSIKKTVVALLVVLMLSIALIPVSGLAETGTQGSQIICESKDKANAVYLYDTKECKNLYEQNINTIIAPASTVKLMTALVAFDRISNINQKITITADMIYGIESHTLDLKLGETVSVKDLLIALTCGGYNDAAQALAVISCGSVNTFVSEMNKRAQSIGAVNTIYKDPTGIDDGAQTTAYDTMLIAQEFMNNSTLIQFSALPSYLISATNKTEDRLIYNRNALISSYTGSAYLNPHAIGMNAGMTSEGGYCVVTSANTGDRTYICIVMGARYGKDTETIYSYKIANELLSQVTKLALRPVISSKDSAGTISVVGAHANIKEVSLSPKTDVYAYLPQEYQTSGLLEYTYIYNDNELVAPLKKGNVVGKIVVRYDGEVVATTDIVVNEDVERHIITYSLYLIRNFIVSRLFVVIIISFVLMLVIKLWIQSKHQRRKNARIRRF